MRKLRGEILSLVLIASAFALSVALADRLPQNIPSHWNLRGQADGFTPKPWGLFVLPLVMAGTYLLLLVLPAISPRGFRFEPFRGAWGIVRTAILAFILFVHAVILLSGIGAGFAMERAIEVGTGLLFVVLGNYMGKLTKNFFVGIRTPWTLASDEVWLRTHRLGGKLFLAAGLVLVAAGLTGTGFVFVAAVVAVAAAALVSVLYSYLLYRRLEGFKQEAPG